MWIRLAIKLLGVIYADVSPGLKEKALADLQELAAKESGEPVLAELVKMAAAFVAVVPEVLPT